jgi:glycosyltransferase involved in cell wall biosynthesis
MEEIILSIFVPCFNEEKNIAKALSCIKQGVQNISYEVLVVDDASKDKTIEMVEKYKKNNPNLNIKVFQNKSNKGVGFNYYATAHQASGKYYMLINGDGVEPPDEIKKIVNNIGKADMILTYIDDRRSIFRRVISRTFVMIINMITLNNVKYYNGPNIYLLENVKLYHGSESNFGFQAELIAAQLRQKKTYIEIEFLPDLTSSLPSQSLSWRVVPGVIGTIISIFLNQIIYVLKKILKIN